VINSAARSSVTLGNDVNLAMWRAQRALLGRAKDNNASCAIGPFIRAGRHVSSTAPDRLRDDRHRPTVAITHTTRVGDRRTSAISRPLHRYHQYPDGVMLFIGTMFNRSRPAHRERLTTRSATW